MPTSHAFYISLPYLFWDGNQNFGIAKHIHRLKQTGFLGLLSVCEMQNFNAVYKQRIEWAKFYRLFKQMLPLSCDSEV